MSRALLTRVSILLLAAVLLSSPAFALGGRTARLHTEPGLFAALLQLLESLVPAEPAIEKGRGTLDPNGATAEGTPDDEIEGRGTIDPNG